MSKTASTGAKTFCVLLSTSGSRTFGKVARIKREDNYKTTRG